jgi:Tol biopolymer transport system component
MTITKTPSHDAVPRVPTLRLALAACLIGAACNDSTGPDPGDQPDARPIVYFRREELPAGWTLYRVSATGGAPTRMTLSMTETLHPAVSPDGSRLAFAVETDPVGVYVSAADGSGARLVYAGRPDHIAWSPDGTRLAIGLSGEIVVVGADGTGVQVITATLDTDARHPSWSPNDRIAFASQGFGFVTDIYTMAPDGGDVRLLVSGEGLEARDPAWSPDGSRLAFAFGGFGSSSIFTVDANGGDRRRLTPEPEWGFWHTDLGPAWSPSGRWIAFQRERSVCTGPDCDSRWDVFVVRADGAGEVRSLTSGSAWGGVRPSW